MNNNQMEHKIDIFSNNTYDKQRKNPLTWFARSTQKTLNIEVGDKLCLIPDGRYWFVFPELDGESYEHHLQRFIDTGNKFFVDIDVNQKTASDLIALFIVESKKIIFEKGKDGCNLFDLYFNEDSNLVFNGIITKRKKCLFLDFDS